MFSSLFGELDRLSGMDPSNRVSPDTRETLILDILRLCLNELESARG